MTLSHVLTFTYLALHCIQLMLPDSAAAQVRLQATMSMLASRGITVYLCSAQGHHRQQDSATPHQDAPDLLNEPLLTLVSGQMPRHPIRRLHHHCTTAICVLATISFHAPSVSNWFRPVMNAMLMKCQDVMKYSQDPKIAQYT